MPVPRAGLRPGDLQRRDKRAVARAGGRRAGLSHGARRRAKDAEVPESRRRRQEREPEPRALGQLGDRRAGGQQAPLRADGVVPQGVGAGRRRAGLRGEQGRGVLAVAVAAVDREGEVWGEGVG